MQFELKSLLFLWIKHKFDEILVSFLVHILATFFFVHNKYRPVMLMLPTDLDCVSTTVQNDESVKSTALIFINKFHTSKNCRNNASTSYEA